MKSLAVIIPCFNEADGLPRLFSELKKLENNKVLFSWIFVNDGSTDSTGKDLEKFSQELHRAKVIHHEKNKNLGAAIRTGIDNVAGEEYVAFLDSDCTYEPSILFQLVEKLIGGADFVTASPYHPSGAVLGVPPWRLGLSKGLSLLYRWITGYNIYTYTAMVRAMRTNIARECVSSRNDFTSVAEMLLCVCKKKYKVEEVPTTLSVRVAGYSKMRIGKTIFSHITLIIKFVFGL